MGFVVNLYINILFSIDRLDFILYLYYFHIMCPFCWASRSNAKYFTVGNCKITITFWYIIPNRLKKSYMSYIVPRLFGVFRVDLNNFEGLVKQHVSSTIVPIVVCGIVRRSGVNRMYRC